MYNLATSSPCINLSQGFLHKSTQEYDLFDNDIKKSVNIILEHIKIVFANDDEHMYNYLINWLAYAVTATRKMITGIYSKSGQGTGKTSLFLFLQEFVVGESLMLITTDASVLDNFNNILENVIFLLF